MAEEKLVIDITAKDDASAVIDPLVDKVGALEGASATVAVDADDQATETLDEVQGSADSLDGTDASVAVDADDQATPTIDEVQGSVDTLDGADASVAVDADDQATPTLDEVQGAVDGLDGADASVTVDADDQASGTLDDVQGAVDDLDGADASVTVEVDDEATPVIEDATSALDDFDGREASASLSVDDQASGALDRVSGSAATLSNAFSAGGAMGLVEHGLSNIGPAGAAAAVGIAAAVATVGEGITKFQDLAIQVDNFSTKTGASLDASSRLVEVANDLNTSVSAVESSIGRMNKVAEASPQLFDEIGASIAHTKDGAVDSAATFESVVTALGKIPEGTARTTAGFAIMGKGWANMSEFVGLSADELRARLESVSDVKIITPEKVDQAHSLRDAFDTMSDAVDDFFGKIGEALAPAMTELATVFGEVLQKATPLAEELGGDLADALVSLMPLFKALADGVGLVAKGLEETSKSAKIWGKGIYEATQGAKIEATNEELGKLTAHMGAWADAAEGTVAPTEEAAAATAKHAAELAKTREAYAATAAALEKWATDLGNHIVKVGEASVKLGELGGALDQIGLRQDALSQIFKLDDGPTAAAGQIRDIATEIDGLSEVAKGVKVGDVLANSVKADKFLDAIDKLKPEIQSAVATAFGSGGPEAATAMANGYLDQVTKELGGKFTREQVATMLGLDNIEATIAVAVEKSSIETAKRELAILTGVTGQTPYTASIALALDAGTITGEQAKVLIQPLMDQAGIEVPAPLKVTQTDEALAEAQAALDAGKPVTMTVEADIAAARTKADEAKAYADSLVGTEGIDGDKAKAMAEAAAAKAYADSLVGTEGINADKAQATAEANAAKAYTDSLIGTMGVDGDPAAANAASKGAKDYADSLTANIKVSSNASQISSDLDQAAKNRYATIFVKTSGAGFMLGSTSSGSSQQSLSVTPAAATTATTATTAAAQAVPIYVNVPAPVINVAAPAMPPIVVKLDGRPIAAMIGSTTAPAVRAAAMSIRAGRA